MVLGRYPIADAVAPVRSIGIAVKGGIVGTGQRITDASTGAPKVRSPSIASKHINGWRFGAAEFGNSQTRDRTDE